MLSLYIHLIYYIILYVFRSHAYDVYAIKVGHIPNGVVGEPVEFESNYKLYKSK